MGLGVMFMVCLSVDDASPRTRGDTTCISHAQYTSPNPKQTTHALPREAELVVTARELDARAGVNAAEQVHGRARGQVQVLHDVVL